MPRLLQFTTTELILLIFNLLAFGACFVLLLTTGPSGPLILLTIGTAGLAAAKIGAALLRGRSERHRQPEDQA